MDKAMGYALANLIEGIRRTCRNEYNKLIGTYSAEFMKAANNNSFPQHDPRIFAYQVCIENLGNIAQELRNGASTHELEQRCSRAFDDVLRIPYMR